MITTRHRIDSRRPASAQAGRAGAAPRVWHHVAVPDPQASAAPVDSGPAPRIRLARPIRPEIRPYFVLALISLAVSLYLTRRLLGDLPNRMVAGNPGDIRLFTWYLEHDSQSVLH